MDVPDVDITPQVRPTAERELLERRLPTEASQPTWRGHLQILRIDHWFKNVFVVPGIVVHLSMDPTLLVPSLWWRIGVGLLATCVIASSNYVINEILDAPFDRLHPTKCTRPAAAGRVHLRLGYLQWLLLATVGFWLAAMVSLPFMLSLGALWVMGCVYNIPPMRSKDVPYVDVLTEALNNPLRMLAGWYIVGSQLIPQTSLLISYWMVGCYFMGAKRFAEYRGIRNVIRWAYLGKKSLNEAAKYRKSFGVYTEARLLVSITFYAAASMLFFGAFLMRYRLELVLSFPFVALVLAVYQAVAFEENSPVQNPEKLYKVPLIVIPVAVCAAVMAILLFVDIPVLHQIFLPTMIRD